jgi:hypothetical protein
MIMNKEKMLNNLSMLSLWHQGAILVSQGGALVILACQKLVSRLAKPCRARVGQASRVRFLELNSKDCESRILYTIRGYCQEPCQYYPNFVSASACCSSFIRKAYITISTQF